MVALLPAMKVRPLLPYLLEYEDDDNQYIIMTLHRHYLYCPHLLYFYDRSIRFMTGIFIKNQNERLVRRRGGWVFGL